MSNTVSATDKRILISADELYMHVHDCADGCDEGFDQVVLVSKDELDKEHGEDNYAVAMFSESNKAELYALILDTHSEQIADEDSDWNHFELSDIDSLFDDILMVTDHYTPPVESEHTQVKKPVQNNIVRGVRGIGSANNPRFDRGNPSPGTW